jgi:hypothetical protein
MSLVSDTHKFIYFSAGRVATGSIGSALHYSKGVKVYQFESTRKEWKKYSKHMPAKIIHENIGPKVWKTYFKFSFVRNPYDWVSSVYFHSYKRPPDGKLREEQIMKVVNYLKSPQGRRYDDSVTMRTQKGYLSSKDGKLLTDHICRYENIQEDFNYICDKIGVPHVTLTKINSSKASQKPYREYYTDEAKELVDNYFAEDISFFNYTF